MAEIADLENNDVERLRECWIAESVCPDLRKYESDLVGDITALIKNQEEVSLTY